MEQSQYSRLYVKPHVIDLVKRRFPDAENERVHRRVQMNVRGRCEDSPLWLEVIRYESYLNSLDQDKIDKLYAAKKEEGDIYFSRAETMANYIHWSQCARWELDEAVALSLGRDPSFVSISQVVPHSSGGSLFAQEYLRRTDLVKRARGARELFEPTPPGDFLTWAKLRQLEFPKELEEALEARGHTIFDMKKLTEDHHRCMEKLAKLSERVAILKQERDDLSAKINHSPSEERELPRRVKTTLLKLVYGMAVAIYGYDRDLSRSSAVSSIRSDLALKGIDIDDGTILKYLREGAQVCPPMDRDPSS